VETERIACCPSAVRTTGDPAYVAMRSGETFLEVNGGGTFAAWEIITPTPSLRGSYGLNYNVFGILFAGPPHHYRGRMLQSRDLTSLRGRHAIPFLLDAGHPSCGFMVSSAPLRAVEPNATSGNSCINRHNGTMNALFLDFSVRPVGLKELWTLKWSLTFDTEDWPRWLRKFKDY